MQKMKGFTLVEMLIVVAIIGILLAIIIPAYDSQTTKARRSDGQTMLLQVQSNMERYAFDNNTYPTGLALMTAYSSNTETSSEGHYQVSVVAATAGCPIVSCYVLRAVPQGGQASDGNLDLQSNGTKVGNW